MSTWPGQDYGRQWAQFGAPNTWKPHRAPGVQNQSKRFQNRTNLLLQKLLQKFDPEKSEEAPTATKSNQWTCPECGTGHWNDRLQRCRFCRASRPQKTAAAGTKGTSPSVKPKAFVAHNVAQASQDSPASTSKFAPLATDKTFVASVEALGLTQPETGMTVDTGGSTVHAVSMEELQKAQEAYNDIAAKFGAESIMAKALHEQLDELQKLHSPLKITKNVVGLNNHILRLQKDVVKHQSDLDKYKTSVQKSIDEHKKAIQELEASLASEELACQAAIASDQAVLTKLQAEVDALNTTRAPFATPSPAPQAITPEAVQQIMQAMATSGLLNAQALQDQTGAMASLTSTLTTLQPTWQLQQQQAQAHMQQQQWQQQQLLLQQQQQQQQFQQVSGSGSTSPENPNQHTSAEAPPTPCLTPLPNHPQNTDHAIP